MYILLIFLGKFSIPRNRKRSFLRVGKTKGRKNKVQKAHSVNKQPKFLL